jgi:hypothetical protein
LGLLLSTPLTLCVVVFTRHVDRLQFIDIMLGDQPALTPQQAAYQRMLTGDLIEAIEQARALLKESTVIAYYDKILIGALRLAQADAEQGRLDDVRLENIFKTVSDIVEDLAEHGNSDTEPAARLTGRPSSDRKVGERRFWKASLLCSPDWAGWTIVGSLTHLSTKASMPAQRGCPDDQGPKRPRQYASVTLRIYRERGSTTPSESFPDRRLPPGSSVYLLAPAAFLPLPNKAQSRLARSRPPLPLLQIPRAAPVASLGTKAIVGGSGFK